MSYLKKTGCKKILDKENCPVLILDTLIHIFEFMDIDDISNFLVAGTVYSEMTYNYMLYLLQKSYITTTSLDNLFISVCRSGQMNLVKTFLNQYPRRLSEFEKKELESSLGKNGDIQALQDYYDYIGVIQFQHLMVAEAAANDNLLYIKELAKKKFKWTETCFLTNEPYKKVTNDYVAMINAAEHGHMDTFLYFWKKCSYDEHTKCLVHAARGGSVEISKMILETHFLMEQVREAMIEAAIYNHYELFTFYFKYLGCDNIRDLIMIYVKSKHSRINSEVKHVISLYPASRSLVIAIVNLGYCWDRLHKPKLDKLVTESKFLETIYLLHMSLLGKDIQRLEKLHYKRRQEIGTGTKYRKSISSLSFPEILQLGYYNDEDMLKVGYVLTQYNNFQISVLAEDLGYVMEY
jgi:hypothetical protein